MMFVPPKPEKAIARALGLMLMFLTLADCARPLSFPEASPYVVSAKPTEVPISNEISMADDWVILRRKIRDVLVLDQEVLVSNSAPPMGRGPDDGEPYLIALDLQHHTVEWRSKYVPIAPIVANSRDVFIVEQNRVIGLDRDQGTARWITPFSGSDFALAYADDALLTVVSNQMLYAFDTLHGSLRWRSALPFPPDLSVPLPTDFGEFRQRSSLAKDGELIYVRGMDRRDAGTCLESLTAFSADTGIEVWQTSIVVPQAAEGCTSASFPLSFGEGLLSVVNWSGYGGACMVTALDELTGRIAWSHTNLEDCSSETRAIFLDRQLIVVTSAELMALDREDGHLIWQRERPLGGYHQLVSDKGLIASTQKNTPVYVLELMNIISGKTAESSLTVPTACSSETRIVPGNEGSIVLENGNCLRSIAVPLGPS